MVDKSSFFASGSFIYHLLRSSRIPCSAGMPVHSYLDVRSEVVPSRRWTKVLPSRSWSIFTICWRNAVFIDRASSGFISILTSSSVLMACSCAIFGGCETSGGGLLTGFVCFFIYSFFHKYPLLLQKLTDRFLTTTQTCQRN